MTCILRTILVVIPFLISLPTHTFANPEVKATLSILTDFDQAKALSKKENKPVFLEFMSSSCGHCQAFKKNVISNPAFIAYANKNLITVIHDYQDLEQLPADEKKKRVELMEKLKISGFPTILLISDKGKILLRKSGYNDTPADKIIKALEKAASSK